MLKLNDRFSLRRDKYQWILTEYKTGIARVGKNKGQTVTTKHEQYFPWLDQAIRRVAELDCQNATTLSAIEDAYKSAGERLAELAQGCEQSLRKADRGLYAVEAGGVP